MRRAFILAVSALLVAAPSNGEVKLCGDNGEEPRLVWTGSKFAVVYDRYANNFTLRTFDPIVGSISPEVDVYSNTGGLVLDGLVSTGSSLALVSTYPVYFMSFDETGSVLIPLTLVSAPTPQVSYAWLTWTGQRYYVTWSHLVAQNTPEVMAAALDAAGSIVVPEGTLAPPLANYSAIAWSPSRQVIGSAWLVPDGQGSGQFYAANVSPGGQLLGSVLMVADSDDLSRTLVPFENGFALGTRGNVAADEAYFTSLDENMDPVGPTVNVAPGELHQKVGTLVWTGSGFIWPVEYWQGVRAEMYIYRLDRTGAVLGQRQRITTQDSYLGGVYPGPDAAFAGNVVGIVWQDFREKPSDPLPDVWYQYVPTVEVLVGAGAGSINAPQVKSLSAFKGEQVLDFAPYGGTGYGSNVAAGSINPDAVEEVITGAGPGAVYGPQARSFTGAGEPMSKVNFYAYGTLKYGVHVATTDLDGDGMEEMMTGPGPGAVFGPHARGWNYDGGSVSPMGKVSYYAYSTLKYGVEVAGGDVDGDNFGEIVTGPGPGTIFGAHLRGWNYDNGSVTGMSNVNAFVFSTAKNGLLVSAGDLTADGKEEILASAGPDPAATSEVRAYGLNPSLTQIGSVVPFTTMGGSHLGAGDMTLDGREELATTPGFLPANPGRVMTFDYATGTFQSMAPWDQDVFPGFAYGATVAIGNVGI